MPVIGPLAALIDTGADGSLVPVRYLRAIPSLAPVDRRWLRSHWGESRMVRLYLVDVEVAGIRLPDIEVVADSVGDEVVLGRNALNRLRLVLDGPKQVIDISGCPKRISISHCWKCPTADDVRASSYRVRTRAKTIVFRNSSI